MQPTFRTTAYNNNRADGNSTNFYGDIYGNVHLASQSSGAEPNHCLRDLRVTDPRDDRTRIEGDKDKLLRDCYTWILDDANFQRWRWQNDSRLLWIRGDPGKGKTMMTIGLIAELSQGYKNRLPSRTVSKILSKLNLGSQPCLLAYFFCQSTHPELNNAVSVLRGLIFMLIDQREQLMRHIQKRYEAAGRQLFEGPNALYALRGILSDILNDPSLPPTYLLVDALDECGAGLSDLLPIITDDSLVRRARVKWLVTSRNILEIERYLQPDSAGIKVSLEVCASHMSKAVAAFIDFKVQHLATTNKYDARLQAEVQRELRNRAEGTFLWVSLVCKELQGVALFRTQEVLQAMPSGLNPLYERMMIQIMAQGDVTTAIYCKAVLRAVTIAFRPLHLLELVVVAGLPGDLFDSAQRVSDLVARCGSFLAVRDNTVSFIHLSAKDYFTSGNGQQVFDGELAEEHGRVTYHLLKAMRGILRRDMCGLGKLGGRTEGVAEQIKNNVLTKITYACEYWIDHLCDSSLTSLASSAEILQDQGTIDLFLQEKFVYWLEALGLCKSVSKGVVSIERLLLLLQARNDTNAFTRLVKDAHRFIMYHRGAIEGSPLQAYVSALLFSPRKSLVRKLFHHEEPDITIIPSMNDSWSACLQTLEGHSDWVNSVAFSPDSTWLASGSWDRTVKVWDPSNGACLQTLEGHSDSVNSVAFSPNSTQLASGSDDKTIKIWDTSSGTCLQTLEGHSDSVYSVAFSPNSTRLVSGSWDRTVKIWDMSSRACLQTLKGHSDWVYLVAFSPDSTLLVSGSYDKTVKIWDASNGACLQTLKGHSHSVRSVAFSPDSTQLVSGSGDRTVKIWDASNEGCLQTLEGHSDSVNSVAFSPNSTWLASGSKDRTVKIWDPSNGACLQTLEGHSDLVDSVAFSPDSTRLASGSKDRTVKIWDPSNRACLQIPKGHSDSVCSVAFSPDSTRLASGSKDRTVKIWDTSNGACLQTLEGHSDLVDSVAFSPDSTWLASGSWDRTVKIWDVSNKICLQTLKGHSHWVNLVAFSPDSTRLVSGSDDKTVKIWDPSSGTCLQTLKGHSYSVNSVAFSPDSTRLASGSDDKTVKIWDPSSGTCLQTLEDRSGSDLVSLASLYSYNIIKEPWQPISQDISISADGTWIYNNGQKLLWLPIEYRPRCIIVSGSCIGLGTGSGKVWIYNFKSVI